MDANLERPESTPRGPMVPWSSRTRTHPFGLVRTGSNYKVAPRKTARLAPAAALFVKYATQTHDFRTMRPPFQFLISDFRFPIRKPLISGVFRSFQELNF